MTLLMFFAQMSIVCKFLSYTIDHNVLKAVFKHKPTKNIEFRLGHLGDREDWEEGLNRYLE